MCIATDIAKYTIGQIWTWKDNVDNKNICQSPLLRGSRPVIIIGYINEVGYRGRATILPITHANKAVATNQLERFFLHPIQFEDNLSYIQCNQPMTVPTVNLDKYIGCVKPSYLADVLSHLNAYLVKGVNEPVDLPKIKVDNLVDMEVDSGYQTPKVDTHTAQTTLSALTESKSNNLAEPVTTKSPRTLTQHKKHAIKIYNRFDNKRFESIKSAAEYYNVNYSTLRTWAMKNTPVSIGQFFIELD